MMRHKPSIVVVAAALILVGVGAGGLYYYRYSTAQKFFAQYGAAREVHHSGNYDESIALFEKALLNAPDPATAAQTRLKIAFDLFSRNLGNDRAEAYAMYKGIVSDSAVPARFRSFALNDMAFTMDLTGNEALLKELLFNDAPYSTFLTEAEGDVHGAVRRVYELSDSIYPTALAKAQIALMYAVPLLNGHPASGLTKKETAELIQRYVREAEPLINAVAYEKSKLAHLYMCRAMSLGISGNILNNVSLSDLEAAYKLAIATAGGESGSGDGDDVHSQTVGIVARLFYAMALYSRTGTSRAGDIEDTLKVFANVDSDKHRLVLEYLRGVAERPDGNFAKRRILALAKISPELRVFLGQIGWVI